MPSRAPISPSCSILLDLVRFVAALIVLYAHFSSTAMTVGLPNGFAVGNLAVSVFFVLSGFVIRMVTVSGIATPKAYLTDRASRVYSGVLPCLLLTFVLAAAAAHINPHRYAQMVHPFSWAQIPVQFLANMTFTSQLWGYAISPPANGPFWSISFEVLYYAIYGLVFYSIKRRWFWVALLLLIAGPSMVLNAPFWLLGCLVYDVFARVKDDRRAPLYASIGLAALLAVLFAGRHPLIRLIDATSHTERAAWVTRLVPMHALLFRGQIPWFSRVSTSYVVSSVVMSAFILWALLLLTPFLPDAPERVVKAVRLVANSTFALYLLHVPLLVLISTAIGHAIRSRVVQLAVPSAIVIVCVLLSISFDQFRRWLRKG
jgi:peptidoglycan/LPS O-acetylase OafA/YrhL